MIFCLCDVLVYSITRMGEDSGSNSIYSMYIPSLMPPCSSRLSIRIVADEQEQAGSVPKRLRPYMHLSKAKAQ
jgi:hypothetical protein